MWSEKKLKDRKFIISLHSSVASHIGRYGDLIPSLRFADRPEDVALDDRRH